MPFRPVEPEKLSSAVVRQVEELILSGILRPGERLPAERELSERLGVSRPSLREALSDLQEQGLLEARPGAGVFVADVLGSAFSPALQRLMRRHDLAVDDYLAFRRDLEGHAAARAARAGSDADLAVVQQIMDKMESAHATNRQEDEAQLDAQFHMSIIEASHNVVMLHMMRSMYELLQQGVFYNRSVMFGQNASRMTLLEQHRAINRAIQGRDADAARAAVEAHMDFIRDCLIEERRGAQNEEMAQRRLDHETTRRG